MNMQWNHDLASPMSRRLAVVGAETAALIDSGDEDDGSIQRCEPPNHGPSGEDYFGCTTSTNPPAIQVHVIPVPESLRDSLPMPVMDQVQLYANDEHKFFDDFSAAFAALMKVGYEVSVSGSSVSSGTAGSRMLQSIDLSTCGFEVKKAIGVFVEPPQCTLQATGQYLQAVDLCSAYVHCNGQSVITEHGLEPISCPPETLFNNARQYCDWPFNFECPGLPPTPPPKKDQCTLQLTGQYFQAVDSCSAYVRCDGQTVLGSPISCSSGVLFNNERQYCDWPHNFKCL